MRSLFTTFCAVCLVLASIGCDEVGEGRFEATITGDVKCLDKAFPFEPEHFAAIRTENGSMIRMQKDAQVRTRADLFGITILSETDHSAPIDLCPDLLEMVGTAVPVGPEECMQAYFRFADTCSRVWINPQVIGTVTFTEAGLSEGDIIEGTVQGTLSDVVIDDSSGEPELIMTEIGTVNGEFRFEVRVGEAYQIFGVPVGPEDQPL